MRVKLVILFCILKIMSYNPVDGHEIVFVPRIVGGSPASDGQAPYQCSYQFKDSRHFCSCVVISSQWILTAAHCMGKDNIQVRVGTNNYRSGGEVYEIEREIRHPEYHKRLNDIGLLRVRGNIQFNDKVKPINYGNAEVPPGTQLLATGWGLTDANNSEYPDDLQQITLASISEQECQQSWQVVNSQICTLGSKGQGICKGDAGSPLVLGDTLVGLASFGLKECASGIPDVYTKVSHYADWIKQTAN